MKIYTLYIVLLLTAACGQLKKSQVESETLPPLEVPPSYLNFQVNFPAEELESGINYVLPKVLADGGQSLNNPQDSLFLKITRRGALNLEVEKGELFASIPLEVSASIRKKVLGMTFSNEDAPVHFTGTINVSADVDLSDNWELDIFCKWQGVDWNDEPKISLAGISIEIGPYVESYFASRADMLSDVICQSIESSISFREVLSGVWKDVQEPVLITTPGKNFYLHSRPIALAGETLLKDDTLAVQLEYRTGIQIDGKSSNGTLVPLPNKSSLLNDQSVFLAYPVIFIKYSEAEELLSSELTGQEISYEGYTMTVRGVKVGNRGQQLKLSLLTEGEINGTIHIYGTPALDDDLHLTLENFEYQIESNEEWVKVTDMALHAVAESYMESLVQFDARPFLNNLDETILDGLEDSPLGEKLDLSLRFSKINQYQMRLTKNGLQWIFIIEGNSSLNLDRALFR